jgi:flagellar basal-body rod protein FlgB
MGLIFSDAHNLVAKAIDYRSIRHQMIASNISNIDTPYYQARDIDFETTLSNETLKLQGKQNFKKLSLANTQDNHLTAYEEIDSSKATLFYRDGHSVRNDANSVNLDVEMGELSKNSIMFTALAASLKKDSMIMKNVIDSGRNL